MVGVVQDSLDTARAAEQLLQLPEILANATGFEECVAALEQGKIATFDAVWGSTCALLSSALAKRFSNLLIVVPDNKFQDNLLDDLPTFYSGMIERFPACFQSSGEDLTIDLEYGDRLRLLKSLASGDDIAIIVANVQALMQRVPSRDEITSSSRRVAVGDRLNPDFVEWLISNGFHTTSAVELPGEFSNRGGILDVYAPDWTGPVRIELFDDEVESLRQFDIGTQRSVEDLAQVEITVHSSVAVDDGHLVDYLTDNTLLIQVEPEQISEQAARYLERSSNPNELHSWHDINNNWSHLRMASASQIATGDLGNRWQLPADSLDRFSGDPGEIRTQVERLGMDANIFLVARVEGEIHRVDEILSTTAVAQAGRLHLTSGCVHAGFRLRGVESTLLTKDTGHSQLAVLGCDQLFQRTELRRRGRRRLGKAIDSFLDLRNGDLIVHLSHGIGRFRGLKILEKDNQLTEHLELEFHGGTRIYVPASKIDLVQKYVGGTKTHPTLARIGGKSWVKQKQAAAEAVQDLAAEMIELQASRRSRPGIAFSRETQWQYDFEHSFPFRETPDQLTAIDSIKSDMQKPRPMDRLLCGDVGFGKTEVAMRAAFKAVENGYQVGVLVPTTVLAEQHFRTFNQRMSEFPLEIAKLSRFCSAKELKATVAKLKTGQVDIAIGTHRLVSKDIDFYNLGLVIIDEEQRFGVEHKERLKNLCSEVDVLTMSATPIPRTLHMSLVGVRDISNLETAPEDRISIETRVTRFDEELIRNAVLREINRGGQIFFVHNRVNDIHVIRERLERIVPEASIDVGHGQMPEGQLEKVMTRFINNQFDLLLATTIIESGLDIPNANTIFVDEADKYGLSDLHQLRGRVGRYKHRAYCYMLIQPNQHLNPTAAKRLQAIETFSEMGAGFAISMRDLEIRGAGNLLGTQQSGHIASVGYELYCQLLENAVRKQKQMPAKLSIHVDIDLPVAAYLPDEYIDDRRQKIDLYRRLTRLEQFDQVAELREEIRDRFGNLPKSVERLLRLCELKLEAAVWQIESIFIQETYLGFKFSNLARFQQLAKSQKAIRIVDDETAFITLKSVKIPPDKMLALVKSLLRPKA